MKSIVDEYSIVQGRAAAGEFPHMNQSKFLKIIMALSIVAIIAFPLYTIVFQLPSFTRLLAENTTNEAARTATHLSAMLLTEDKELERGRLSPFLIDQIKDIMSDPHFLKLKIYSPAGETIYSTDPGDVGNINKRAYFKEIAASRKTRARTVDKGSSSLEEQVVYADVVETYVPITKGDRLIGIFEIYYDITAEKQKLYRLLYRSYGALFILSVLLMAAVVISTMKANKSVMMHRRAEEEREQLIGELQGALAKVKTLSGMLPICASCKKIRDDKGYWNQIETYLRDHTAADFSHSICPECLKKLYPGFSKE